MLWALQRQIFSTVQALVSFPKTISKELDMKDSYQNERDQQAKQLKRADEIGSDAARKAGKRLDKAEDTYAKDEGKAARNLGKAYDKAAREDDAEDALEERRDADTDFAKADQKAGEKLDKQFGKAAKVVGEDAEAEAKNRDPMTGAPESHPVGTGVGTAGGAIAGAAAGALAGPAGALVGGVVGAVAGAAAGHDVGETINPTVEEKYWKSVYGKQPYYNDKYSYDDYSPAYRAGYEGRNEYGDLSWDRAEPKLASRWEKLRGKSRLKWNEARLATRAAWERASQMHN
ncbi:MAG TPA: hypothetical protein VGH80_12345 [Xanthomonadaceae bacterium]|jgi:hypothetical protein